MIGEKVPKPFPKKIEILQSQVIYAIFFIFKALCCKIRNFLFFSLFSILNFIFQKWTFIECPKKDFPSENGWKCVTEKLFIIFIIYYEMYHGLIYVSLHNCLIIFSSLLSSIKSLVHLLIINKYSSCSSGISSQSGCSSTQCVNPFCWT